MAGGYSGKADRINSIFGIKILPFLANEEQGRGDPSADLEPCEPQEAGRGLTTRPANSCGGKVQSEKSASHQPSHAKRRVHQLQWVCYSGHGHLSGGVAASFDPSSSAALSATLYPCGILGYYG